MWRFITTSPSLTPSSLARQDVSLRYFVSLAKRRIHLLRSSWTRVANSRVPSNQVVPPNFFWSRTICGSRTVNTHHLVPGKLNMPNIIRSKVWKTRIDKISTWKKCVWEFVAIFKVSKYTKIPKFINKTRLVKIIAVNIFFCLEIQKAGLFVYHLESLRVPQLENHCVKVFDVSINWRRRRLRAFQNAFAKQVSVQVVQPGQDGPWIGTVVVRRVRRPANQSRLFCCEEERTLLGLWSWVLAAWFWLVAVWIWSWVLAAWFWLVAVWIR